MIPRFDQPASPVPDHFPLPTTQPSTVDSLQWHDIFIDARLKKCVELALRNNRDLRVAVLNVERAQARYRIQRAALVPELDAQGGYTRSESSATVANLPADVNQAAHNQYDARVGLVSYEIDLFGRVRSLNRQQLELYFSDIENQRSSRLSLVAQVAADFLRIREYEEQLQLARETHNSLLNSYELTRQRTDAGTVPASDLASADVQLQSARVSIAQYERSLAQTQNGLEELIGSPLPADSESATRASLVDEDTLTDMPAGLPSDLIHRRPDILSAEHKLLAANANIGAARAAFFPSITLTGNAGFSTADLSNLFDSPSRAWSFSPQISVPLFDGGRNQANLDVATVEKKIEIANYEKSIQVAFREVSDALAARASYTSQLQAQRALVRAQEQRYDFAQSRYQNGLADYLNILTAQQDLFAARQSLISARVAQLQNLIALYKALGGGWNEAEWDAQRRG